MTTHLLNADSRERKSFGGYKVLEAGKKVGFGLFTKA
jgi:hypothetical protein